MSKPLKMMSSLKTNLDKYAEASLPYLLSVTTYLMVLYKNSIAAGPFRLFIPVYGPFEWPLCLQAHVPIYATYSILVGVDKLVDYTHKTEKLLVQNLLFKQARSSDLVK